jgi:HD superfamily phosphohydrolase
MVILSWRVRLASIKPSSGGRRRLLAANSARGGLEAVERVYLLQPLPFTGRIRDAIHGDIEYVKGAEDMVFDSWPVQRLRYIYQLQLAHLVYPSATHTRFSHSLGVMHLAYRMMHRLVSQAQQLGLERGEWKLFLTKPRELLEAARMAGLLHDIGHGPFSHAFDRYILSSGILGYRVGNHEILGYIIYRDLLRETIAKAAGRMGLDSETVVSLVDEALKPPRDNMRYTDLTNGKFSASLAEGDFYRPRQGMDGHKLVRMAVRDFLYPADIMDYLLRDSYFTQAPIGYIDVDRILGETYVVEFHGQLWPAISEKAVDNIVRLLNARKLMYKNVYLHPANKAFDHTLGIILSRCDSLKALIAETLDAMLRDGVLERYKGLTDYTVYGLLSYWLAANRLGEECRDELAVAAVRSLLEYRKPLWKRVRRLWVGEDKGVHLTKGGRERKEELLAREFAEYAGLDPDDVLVDIDVVTAYPPSAATITPYVFIARTVGGRLAAPEPKPLREFLAEHGVQSEIIVTFYVKRSIYEKLASDNEAIRRLSEAAGEALENYVPGGAYSGEGPVETS